MSNIGAESRTGVARGQGRDKRSVANQWAPSFNSATRVTTAWLVPTDTNRVLPTVGKTDAMWSSYHKSHKGVDTLLESLIPGA